MPQVPVIFLAFANERESESRYLRGLAREQAEIRTALEPAVEAGLCEVIVETNATVSSIINTFQKARFKDRIAVFHYGGHADGYQLLLETLEGGNVVAHGEGLVSFFGKQDSLKLVFLNGCSTQQQAIELNQSGVPAVIGTSHSIADDIATRLAVRFYGGVAQGRTIRRAWKEAEDEVKILKGRTISRKLFLEDTEVIPDFFPWELYVREGSEVIEEWNLPEAGENPLFGLPDPPIIHLPEQPYRFLDRYHAEEAEIFFGRSYYIRDLFDRATDGTTAPVILFHGQSGVGKSSLLDAGLLPRLRERCEVIYARRDRTAGLTETLRAALSGLGAGILDAEGMRTYFANQETLRQQEDFQRRINQMEFLAEGLDEEGKAELAPVLARLKARRAELVDRPVPASLQTESVEETDMTFLQAWESVESAAGKPLVILLDQVEEVFTQSRPDDPEELTGFLEVVTSIFRNPGRMPKGKLILSYRKEYHPEIEAGCKKWQIPRESIFLQQLTKKDITEVISGLTRTDRLRNAYRLEVEPELPAIIADDLLADKDSPIAPVLQILLTKMWLLVESDERRYFSVDLYQELQREGLLMGDFLHQQLEEMRRWDPELMSSGMILDVLFFHTTPLGTAASRSREELETRYRHRQDVLDGLIDTCKSLYLLAGGGPDRTVLAHDTLAPLVQNEFKNSDRPGQRAVRIMENKVIEFENDPANTLDPVDLAIVETGQSGMPDWNDLDLALVAASRKRRDRIEQQKKWLRIAAVISGILIIGFGIAALVARWDAVEKSELAETRRLEAEENLDRALASEDSAKVSEARALKAKEYEERAKEEAEANLAEADRQRTRAEFNARIARDSAKSAQEQRKLAETNEQEALKNEQRAQEETRRANIATKEAMSRLYLSTARSLANKSRFVEDSLQKSLLAIQAYEFNRNHQGQPYDPDIHRAMYEALRNQEGDSYRILHSHADVIESLSFSRDGQYLISAGADGKLLRWRWQETEISPLVSLPRAIPRAFAISAAGQILVGGQGDAAKVAVASLNNPAISSNLPLHNGKTWDIVALPGKDRFISSGEDRILMLHEGVQSMPVDTLPTQIKSLTMGPKGRWLVGAGDDGRLWQWDLSADFERSVYYDPPAPRPIRAVVFSLAGDKIAFGDVLGRVHVWNWETKQPLRPPLSGHKSQIADLAFRPDGRQLASGSWDKSVRLWNLDNPDDLPIVLEDHDDWVMSITYTPDGTTLLAGLKNGKLKHWPTRAKEMEQELKQKLTRELSQQEWEQYVGKEIPYEERVKPGQ